MIKKKKVCKKTVAKKKKGTFAARRARVSSDRWKNRVPSGVPDGSKVGKTVLYYQDREETPHRSKRKRVSRIQGRTDKLKRPFGLQSEWGRYK
jgi:hypothetical protein